MSSQCNCWAACAATACVLRFCPVLVMAGTVRENLSKIQERIALAAQRAGRATSDITLIAVSKTHPADAIHEAFAAGVRHFGENRVQEWEKKRAGVEPLQGNWHLIGHLQGNKAARAAKLFDSVDSVDTLAIAQRLNDARAEFGAAKKLRVLLEARISPEAAKSGAEIASLPALAEAVACLPWLELAGLMCIPPFLADVEKVRPYFQELRSLRDNLAASLGYALPVLSMGMSHDFEVAIEEGATEVRVGTALFGGRMAETT